MTPPRNEKTALNPSQHAVQAHQMLGWLRQVLDDGHLVDIDEWNNAVRALENSDVEVRPAY